jgi:predicted oxidoreductase
MNVIWGVMRWGDWGAKMKATQVLELIESGIAHGVTTFDHADIYGGYTTEALFGDALKLKPALRDQIQLVTKCGIVYPDPSKPHIGLKHYNTSASYIRAQVEQSLRNLNTDYIDRLLIHRPDILLDAGEVGAEVQQLKLEGKIRGFGVSNFEFHELEHLHIHCDIEEHQIEISPLELRAFENGLLNQCHRLKIPMTAWSPLAGGRVLRPESDRELRVAVELDAWGKEHGFSRGEAALSWLATHPAQLIPIIGTTKPERLPGILKAVNTPMNHQDWFRIWTASKGEKVPL